MASGGRKASCESTPPSQYSALCQQGGPAVALCPVANLTSVLVALYVTPSDRGSNATFHHCGTGQPGVAGKIDFRA